MNWNAYYHLFDSHSLWQSTGYLASWKGLKIQCRGPQGSVGDLCYIQDKQGHYHPGEIVGFDEQGTQLMFYENLQDLPMGAPIINTGDRLRVGVGPALLGQVLNGFGQSMQGQTLEVQEYRSLYTQAPNVLKRKSVDQAVATGIRVIDGFLTVAQGQRLGIFAGAGVGKSTLLGSLARNVDLDVNVIALIGERGREVREFIEKDLGEKGMAKSVLVVANAEDPPLVRVQAAYVALVISEYFRDQGLRVLSLFDSLTRLAYAQRELGLSLGEMPTARGYPPSLLTRLPHLLERACNSDKGTITSFYGVLVEGDDMEEPVSDTVKGILDGHIVLDRQLAEQNIYPAVDILASISRVQSYIVHQQIQDLFAYLKSQWALYKRSEQLILAGAYSPGSNEKLDKAIKQVDLLKKFIQQSKQACPWEQTLKMAQEIAQV